MSECSASSGRAKTRSAGGARFRLDKDAVGRNARTDQPVAAGLGFGEGVALPDTARHDDPLDPPGSEQLGRVPQSFLEDRRRCIVVNGRAEDDGRIRRRRVGLSAERGDINGEADDTCQEQRHGNRDAAAGATEESSASGLSDERHHATILGACPRLGQRYGG